MVAKKTTTKTTASKAKKETVAAPAPTPTPVVEQTTKHETYRSKNNSSSS